MFGARWGLATLVALVVKSILMAGAFLFVAIYAHGVHPGEDPAYYEAFAQSYVPYFALIFGFALFLGVGRWLARRLGSAARSTAVGVWIVHSLIDLPILLADGSLTAHEAVVTGTGRTLFAAAIWIGARRAVRS